MTILKNYYKLCCKILTNNINEARRSIVQQSDIKLNTKTKTTWNIIKSETGRNDQKSQDGNISDNLGVNSDSFNNYSLSIAK